MNWKPCTLRVCIYVCTYIYMYTYTYVRPGAFGTCHFRMRKRALSGEYTALCVAGAFTFEVLCVGASGL